MTRSANERVKGKWRITEVEGLESPDINQDELAHFEFLDDGIGGFCFGGLDADVDYLAGEHQRKPAVEFTWEGALFSRELCGRGHAITDGKNHMTGQIWIHMGEHLFFKATRWGRWLYDERMKKQKSEQP
ncbi:hypothetical protein KKG66_08820 [bacterium]|nr:hypothetical protein [bacterium]